MSIIYLVYVWAHYLAKSGIPGRVFLDKIGHNVIRCFYVRDGSGETFARISSRSVWTKTDTDMDKPGHFPNYVVRRYNRSFCGPNRACCVVGVFKEKSECT